MNKTLMLASAAVLAFGAGMGMAQDKKQLVIVVKGHARAGGTRNEGLRACAT